MSNSASRPAQDGDTVSVHYTGRLDSGEVFDSSRERDEPLAFVVGAGEVISGFDAAVRGMAVGDSSTVRLEPDDAYGQPDEQLVAAVPKQQAPEGLNVGDQVQVGEQGQLAIVTDVTEESVTIDANHPLAGQALNFEIELVAIS